VQIISSVLPPNHYPPPHTSGVPERRADHVFFSKIGPHILDYRPISTKVVSLERHFKGASRCREGSNQLEILFLKVLLEYAKGLLEYVKTLDFGW
jgi:hypothetical protein